MPRKKTKQKPLEITEGSVTVKIYSTPTKSKGQVYPQWTLVYKLHGQTIRQKSAKLADLMTAGKEACRRIANAQTATLTMTDAEVAEYVSSKETLSRAGITVSLNVVAEAFASALKTLPVAAQQPATVIIACTDYAAKNRTVTPITVAALNEEFHAAKKKQRCDDRHLKDLRVRLDVFAAHFQCNITHITARDFQDWVDKLDVGAQTKLNYLRAVKNAFQYAKSRGYLPKDWNELEDVSPGILPETIVEIYTPAEMEKILRGALGEIDLKAKVEWPIEEVGTDRRAARSLSHVITPEDRAHFKALIPYIATGGFGGLRTAERCRTHWNEFNWDTGNIHVTGKRTRGRTTRSTSRRLVPINETLREWIADYVPKKGTPEEQGCIVPMKEQIAIRKFAMLCRAVGIAPKANALRHSFITYRCAELNGKKHQVAQESGNSPTTIEKHYLELVTAQQAAAWFGIRPKVAANVTQLKAVI